MTGGQGQLARSLRERGAAAEGMEFLFVGRPQVDLAVPGSVAEAIGSAKPDVVINAAAYTAVDDAEDEPELAMRINADAAGEAAAAASAVKAPLIQISTDYVFSGTSTCDYSEEAPTDPIGVYGRSKLAGEEQVRAAGEGHLIVRTAWLYSPFGRNFVKTMLGLAGEREQVRVVADQVGTPTSAFDLADAILHVLNGWRGSERAGLGETYHLAGRGRCSWAEFAGEIFRISSRLGGPSSRVQSISTAEFPTRGRRPANSALKSDKFVEQFGISMPTWRESLFIVVQQILRKRVQARSPSDL